MILRILYVYFARIKFKIILDEAKMNQHSVFVHCAAGISRSTSFIMAYLMKHEGMTLLDAFLHIRKRRTFACPNR